jgi:hypothetical protein
MAPGKPFNNSKWTAGCMVLFALPFFAVGVGTTVWSAWTAWQHTAMQSWVETPATIRKTELKVTHDDGTTYKVLAAYDYEFGGQRFTGERVGIDGGSDNIGRFQQEAYNELKQHLDQKQPFRCFVNPQRPNDAVLYRDLRGEMVAFYTLFATLFGSVGLALITASVAGARQAPPPKDNVPTDAPWTVRADWEAGLIRPSGSTRVAITVLTAVTIYWLIAISPLLWKLPEIMAHDGGFWKWAALVFPAIELILVGSLGYLMIRGHKFGESTLLLASTPGVIGGQLAGVVRTPKPVEASDGFRITLSCLDWISAGDGRSEKSLWQDEQLVIAPLRGDGTGTAIPVLFAIPFDCRESARSGQNDGVHWRLEISARVPGVDYRAKFDVPVFKTAESRPDFKLDEGLAAEIAKAPNYDAILREAGIVKEQLADGVRLVFRMARHFASAMLVSVFFAIWCSAIWAMHIQAPIMAVIFGLFGLLIAVIALDLWFYRSVAEASASGLVLRGGLFGIGRTRVIPLEEIQEFTMKEGMSSGASVWNNILVVLRDGKKQTVGRLISSTLAQRAVIDELTTALKLPPSTSVHN